MKTQYMKRLQHILVLLALSALLIPMFSCSEKKPRVKRSDASGDETAGEEPSKDVVVVQNNPNPVNPATTPAPTSSNAPASPKTPANVFEGTWDVDINGKFGNMNFSYAGKNGDKLEGKITDGSGSVTGDYVVLPNKTVQLNIYSAGVNSIVPYKVSNGGNQIEVIDGNTKIILTKGMSNTTIQNDGNILALKGWTSITNSSDIMSFTSVKKSSAGWTGAYARTPDYGTFTMTAGKITLRSQQNGSVDTYSYRIRNNSILDLTDSNGKTESFVK